MFDIATVQRFLSIHAKNPTIYEVEVRLGRFDGNGFVAGIAKNDFYRMIKFHEKKFNSETSTVNQRINGQMRHENDKVIKKEPVDRFDAVDYDVRISLSKEVTQQSSARHIFDESSIMRVMCYTRLKKRTSFFVCPELRLDFTEVYSSQGDTLDGPQVTYEVELEVVREISTHTLSQAILRLLQYWKETHYVIPNSMVASVERSFCRLVKAKNLSCFAGAQPRTMQQDDISLLEKQPYAITYKLDGLRSYLYVTNHGMVTLITGSTIKQIAAIGTDEFDETVLDGELVNKYHAFDAICWKGRDLRGDEMFRCLRSRLSLIDSLVQHTAHLETFYIKEYHFTDSRDELQKTLKTILSRPKLVHGDIDGIIFVPTNEVYPHSRIWRGLLKWKPRVTIDFRVRDNRLFANSTPREIEFKPENMPQAGTLRQTFTSAKYEDGEIYECYWEPNLQMFVPLRHRSDKLKPNFIDVALDNFYAIRNPVTLGVLLGEEYTPQGYLTADRKEKYMVSLPDAIGIIHATEEVDNNGVCNAEPMLDIQPADQDTPMHDTLPGGNTSEDNSDDDEEQPEDAGQMDEIEEEQDESDDEEPQSVTRKVPKKTSRGKREPPALLFGKPVNKWRLPELKTTCVSCNLKIKGKRAVLIEHLQLWESKNGKPV